MTNHIHILATPKVENSVSRLMQHVGGHYVRYFNRMYGRTGTLWEGRFKSCLVENENYFLVCQRYIELNPVRANIVEDPGGYRWSSYLTNALGKISNMIVPHEIYVSLGTTPEERMNSYRKLFSEVLDSEVLDGLRKATRSGLAFGSDSFKDQIEATFERRVRPEKPGRKTEH
jgi:putative transposase